jgi:hypothetical protein
MLVVFLKNKFFINFILYFESFRCVNFKNNFLKNKKYYFNVF